MKTFTATTFMIFLATAALIVTVPSVAFSGSNTGREVLPPKPEEIMSRRTAFATGVTTAALLLAAPSIAFAKEKSGGEEQCDCEGKQNKRSCMDLCLYECIKHGGSNEECAIDCAKQCKSEKGQRTMATPITKKGVDYK